MAVSMAADRRDRERPVLLKTAKINRSKFLPLNSSKPVSLDPKQR